MSKWEIKVYEYGKGHTYTIYSNASLSNAKKNMMRRHKIQTDNGSRVASIVIRDLSKNNEVVYREFFKDGRPKRQWNYLRYCRERFPSKEHWDKGNHDYYKGA